MKKNEINPGTSPIKKRSFCTFNQIQTILMEDKRIHLLWGDVGTGKSTFALQLAQQTIKNHQKVLYLHTKQTSISQIINRILGENAKSREYLLLWNCASLQEQKEIVFDWLLQIHKLESLLNSHQIKLIIIDEISSLYLLSQGNEEQTAKANEQITFILATLAQICLRCVIPIFLLSGFTTKKTDEEQEKMYPRPFGGRYIKYWTEDCQKTAGWEIKIRRTSQPSRMQFQRLSHPYRTESKQIIPEMWTWHLTEKGFQ